MCPHIVALGCLHRRRELHYIDVSGLHLRLHQKVPGSFDDFRQQAEDSDLRLHDNRLVPSLDPADIRRDVEALDREIATLGVNKVLRAAFKAPLVELAERNLFDSETVARPPSIKPLDDGTSVLGSALLHSV